MQLSCTSLAFCPVCFCLKTGISHCAVWCTRTSAKPLQQSKFSADLRVINILFLSFRADSFSHELTRKGMGKEDCLPIAGCDFSRDLLFLFPPCFLTLLNSRCPRISQLGWGSCVFRDDKWGHPSFGAGMGTSLATSCPYILLHQRCPFIEDAAWGGLQVPRRASWSPHLRMSALTILRGLSQKARKSLRKYCKLKAELL